MIHYCTHIHKKLVFEESNQSNGLCKPGSSSGLVTIPGWYSTHYTAYNAPSRFRWDPNSTRGFSNKFLSHFQVIISKQILSCGLLLVLLLVVVLLLTWVSFVCSSSVFCCHDLYKIHCPGFLWTLSPLSLLSVVFLVFPSLGFTSSLFAEQYSWCTSESLLCSTFGLFL